MTAKYKLQTRHLAVMFPLFAFAAAILLMPVPVTEASHLTCDGSFTTPNGDGTNGDDTMPGSINTDIMQGLAGVDTIDGFESDDKLCGGDDRDIITGGFGNDKIFGDGGLDKLDGDQGNDNIQAGFGADNVFGDNDNDTLHHTSTGVNDNDADHLDGWTGDDTCIAGAEDTVVNCNP